MTSSDQAIADNKNSFQTGGALTLSDIANSASYNAESYAVTLGSTAAGAGSSVGLGQARGL